MNILVVSEKFSRGGLETNINTLHNELKKHNKLVYAFGKYEKTSYLNDAKIYSDFHFNYDVTIADFCSDVDRLVKIIEAEKIDVVQVHPFYSVYQAFFATQLTGTKLVYTSHGYDSLTFTPNLFDEILLEYIFEKGISLNLCVSSAIEKVFSTILFDDSELLCNSIDTKKYKRTNVQNNKKWALVSRLDIDKYGSIKKLFEMLPKLDIESIDVYGEGTEKKKLEAMVRSKKLNVNFMGYVDNINEATADKYNGIIGLGRVAIEGLAMGYPVLFAGNDKVCGMIDHTVYEKAKRLNFVTFEFNEKGYKHLNNQLKEVYKKPFEFDFSESIIEDFSVQNIAKRFIDLLNKYDFKNNEIATQKIYSDLKKSNKKLLFHQSINISNLIYQNIKYDTRNILIKNKILIHEEIQINKTEITKIRSEISALKQYTNETIDKKVDYIISNVNFKWIIKNSLRKIFKRRKNGKD